MVVAKKVKNKKCRMKNIYRFIESGREFLEQVQQAEGNFLNYTSSHVKSFRHAYACESIFSTALILSCLNQWKNQSEFDAIRRRAAHFLLGQKSTHWTFNYWVRDSKDFKNMPYPDDLDDTSCALAALHGYDPTFIDGEALAHFVTVLTALEEEEGGPYRTWVVPEDAASVWKDIDFAVNGNIAHLLSLYEVSLPNLERFLEEKIEKKAYTSPYYPECFPIIYFLSRFYRGGKTEDIVRYLMSRRNADGSWGNPLRTALAVSALLNFGVPLDQVEEGVAAIVRNTEPAFKAYPFYVGINPRGDKKRYVAGAPALTMAFCLEALGKYAEQKRSETKVQTASLRRSGRDAVHDHVIKAAQKKFLALPGELKNRGMSVLDKTVEKDTDGQILLLPYFFQQALGGRGKSIPRSLVVSLGLANTFGWMAYTLYDDFLDGDRDGDGTFLSLANVCLRELSLIFGNLFPEKSGFPSLFRETMDRLDAANCWEVVNARCPVEASKLSLPEHLPDYGNFEFLADRSLGHALGPIAIWTYLGYSKGSAEWKRTTAFFRHVLAARQLNDDAHDWEEDLRRGILSSVATDIVRRWQLRRDPTETSAVIDLRRNEDLASLQELCWYETMPHICEKVLSHAAMAENHLKQLKLSQEGLLHGIVDSVRKSAERALREREETLQFLRVYQISE
jgi:hypothetical protein